MQKKLILISLIVFFIVAIFGLFVAYFYKLYPTKYKPIIKEFCIIYNIEPELVASIIKAESSYNNKAISSSGAIGLMQIKPSTAYEIATKLGVDNYNTNMLFEEKTNIQFGIFYLRYLLDYYNQNLINALCAYNAGLSNVNDWLNNGNYSSDGINLINIPFYETKNYIEKINKSKRVYKYIYGIS